MKENPFGGLTFGSAATGQQEAALRLRDRIYTAELGHSGLDDLDRVATHLVATTSDGQVVAALRVIGPEARPFDLERYFDLHGIIDDARRPSEVSRFCVDVAFRHMHREQMVHLGMLKLLVDHSRKRGITDLLTLGLPHLRSLYRVALFEELGTCEHYVWGPAYLMRFDLVRLFEDGSSIARHPVGRLLRGPQLPDQ